MKQCSLWPVLAVAGCTTLLATSACATMRVWKGEGTGTSVTTASNFGDADHWLNGVPASQDDCYFTNCPPNVWNYITASSRYTVKSFNAQHWDNPLNKRNVVFVSDSGLSFSTPSGNCLVLSPHIYADITVDSLFTSWTLNLCGDYTSTWPASDWVGQYTLAADNLNHRLDRYANAPGGLRLNPMAIDHIYIGSGTYSLFAPRGSDEPTVANWSQTAGSRYLFPVSGSSTAWPVGASVTGEGIPADTYLKRIFPDGSIELSKAVEADMTKASNELTFGVLTSVVTQRFDRLSFGGDKGELTVNLNKSRDEDELVLRVARLRSGLAPEIVFNTSSGYKPGTVILEKANDLLSTATVSLRNCHVEFEGNDGFTGQVVTLPASGQQAVVGVASGVSARLGVSAKGLAGTLVKVGEGELVLSLTNAPSSNTGVLQVTAGSVRLCASETAAAQVGQLTLADGTRLNLDGGEVEAKALSVEGTVTLSGPGTLVVPTGTSLSGLRFENGASVRFAGAQAVANWTSPASEVVGCPAVWVDASKESTITADGGRVARIDDVRGAEHFYATASSENADMRPYVTKTCGLAYLDFPDATDTTRQNTDPAHYSALVWNRQVTGIRAVFLVHDTWLGGGEILGCTTGISDFARPQGLDWTYLVIWSGAAQCVKDAACYVNGERRNLRSGGYPYRGGTYSGNGSVVRWLPNVTEVHPTAPGAKADCWGMDPATDQHGQIRLCECLVYTNELTQAERLSIANYLSRKWVGREISYGRYSGAGLEAVDASVSPSFAVASGESMAVAKVTGAGTFGKTGEGTLSLLGCGEGNASLVVSGGRLVVGSGVDETAIPDGAYLHLDASKADTITTGDMNGNKYVKTWKDVRPDSDMSVASLSGTLNPPIVKTVEALQNRQVVDFGPWVVQEYKSNTSPELNLMRNGSAETVAASSGLRTEIVILGSANGGGTLIGGRDSGFNETYGVMRSGGDAANALVRFDGDTGSVPTKNYTHDCYTGENGQNAAIRCNDIRVNGTRVLGTQKDVLSGAYDLVTFSVYDAFGAKCFGTQHYRWFMGGGEMGEVLLYREQLSSQSIDRIEAYLGKKWFGRVSADYPAAKAPSVEVAAGAELELKGGDPLTTGALAGSGRIVGDVVLTEDGVLNVTVADGEMPTLTVSGSIDGDGTVVLSGNLKGMEEGEYKILETSGLTGTWTLDNRCERNRYACNLVQRGDALYLTLARRGMCIIFR